MRTKLYPGLGAWVIVFSLNKEKTSARVLITENDSCHHGLGQHRIPEQSTLLEWPCAAGARSLAVIRFSSIKQWLSIYVDPRILFWSLNLRSFEQQLQSNRKTQFKQVFLRIISRSWNIFARHVASRILWRSAKMLLLPVKLFLSKKTKKFKKIVQNMSKRLSKTMPVRTPNPVFRESFFKFWNSHTNQVLKTPISSGRVTQLISAPWKVITSRREGGREEERGARISILSAPTTGRFAQ